MANLKVNMSMTKNEMPEQDPVVRGGNFEEVALGYDAETAMKEAARCLSCGRAVVDPNLCVGCGQCVIKCQFDAAHLVKKTSIYGSSFSSILPKAAGHTVKRAIKIAVGAFKKD